MPRIDYAKPVLGIAALSGTGKTRLITQLIPLLTQSGLRVGVIKHAHHDIDIDKPGKDSYEMRHAGATPVVLSCDQRIALVIEKPEPGPSDIDELLALIDPEQVDLVLIEGFKDYAHDKLFLFRHEIKGRHQSIDDGISQIINQTNTLAIVSDIDKNRLSEHLKTDKPVLDINKLSDVHHFILNYCNHSTLHGINND